MKTNNRFYQAAVAALTAVVLIGFTASAFAGGIDRASGSETIDKGDLGKYQHDGKFLRRVLTPASRSAGASSVTAQHRSEDVIYDKGELGKYVHTGKGVRRVLTASPRSSETAGTAQNQKVHAFVVDKGELGKYEFNGKFMWPVHTASLNR